MIMLSVIGNRKERELSSHFCQVEVENNHNSAFMKGKEEKQSHIIILNYFTLLLEILGKSNLIF